MDVNAILFATVMVLLSVAVMRVWQLSDGHSQLDTRLKTANAELEYLVARFSSGLETCKTTSERLLNKLEER